MPAQSRIKCLILGGGGHARVLIDSMRGSVDLDSIGILDQDPSLWGKEILGIPVLGGDDLLGQLAGQSATQFIVGLGGVRDNQPRRRLFESGLSHGLDPLTVIHPAASCSPFAQFGAGTVIFPTAVVNAGALVGDNVIINTGSIVEHDCEIADHVHMATRSVVCAGVKVGEGAHIGAGAVVRQLLSIGTGAIVGAGAVVVRDVDPGTVVTGVPARLMS